MMIVSDPCSLESNQTINGSYWEYKPVRYYYSEMQPGQQFSLFCNFICCMICFITSIVLILLVRMVVKKLGSQDFIIPAMLLSLFFSSTSLIMFFSYQIYGGMVKPSCLPSENPPKPGFHLGTVNSFGICSVWLPAIFLGVAVILNINKWQYFSWRVESLSM